MVLPSNLHPAGWVTLIDRFPNAVLTYYDAVAGAVVGQVSVATGFPSNPQCTKRSSSSLDFTSSSSRSFLKIIFDLVFTLEVPGTCKYCHKLNKNPVFPCLLPFQTQTCS